MISNSRKDFCLLLMSRHVKFALSLSIKEQKVLCDFDNPFSEREKCLTNLNIFLMIK